MTDVETLEHLLGIITENRELQCAKVRETADKQAADIIRQAHSSARERMHRHVLKLREKYLHRVSAVTAGNQTLLRQQQQAADRALLDLAWPLLAETLYKLWRDPEIRQQWHAGALKMAASAFVDQSWRIEHPPDFSNEDKEKLKQVLATYTGHKAELQVCDDIIAGIRIIAQRTIVDATVPGLLRQRSKIEGALIARIKQGISGHD
jgi:hypothetical protein